VHKLVITDGLLYELARLPGARKLSCFHCSTKRHFDLHQATLQFAGTISWARYPGWCPFGRSNKSTSHSTRYRTPLGVFLAAITVPTLRSTTARGVLTHTLSPGLTFFIYSPPSERSAHAWQNFAQAHFPAEHLLTR